MPAPAVIYSLGIDAAAWSAGLNQGLELLKKFKDQAGNIAGTMTREWNEAAGLADMSAKLRILGSDIAALQAGIRVAGGDSGIFGMFRFMRRAMADAAAGGTETKRAFDAMGVSLEELGRKPAVEQLLFLLERLRTLDDPSQVYAAQSIFGRSVEDVILLSTKIDQIRDVMTRFGPVANIQARIAEQANEMFDRWTMIKLEIKSITTALAAELLPAVSAIVAMLNRIQLGRGLEQIHNFIGFSANLVGRLPEIGNLVGREMGAQLGNAFARSLATVFGPSGKMPLTPLAFLFGSANPEADAAGRLFPTGGLGEKIKEIMAEAFAGVRPFPQVPPLAAAGAGVISPTTSEPSRPSAGTAPSADAWTRIGAVLFGAGFSASAQVRTAENTQQIAASTQKTAQVVEQIGPQMQAVVDFVRDLTGHS